MQYLRYTYIKKLFMSYLKFKFIVFPVFLLAKSVILISQESHGAMARPGSGVRITPGTNCEVSGKLLPLWASVSPSVKWA